MTDNKRSVERTPIPGEILGNVTVTQPMTVQNMSEAGIQIETPYQLQNNSLHDFRLSLGAKSVVVKGRVVYCQVVEVREGGVLYRSGIEFVEAAPHTLTAVREFVASYNVATTQVIDGDVT